MNLVRSSDMIRDKMVFGVRDERIKERLLREADLTLNKVYLAAFRNGGFVSLC